MDNNAADNGNGKITLALLGAKVDEIIKKLDKLDAKFERQDDRLSALEQGAVQRAERIGDLRQDVDRLNERDLWGTLIAGIAAAVAGIIAWFK